MLALPQSTAGTISQFLWLTAIAVAAPTGSRALAQRAPDDTTKTFFVRRDLVLSAAALGATGVLSVFDKRIAHWTQTPSV